MKTTRILAIFSLLVLFLALLPARRASAATYTVTNTNDSGTGSLRWAINQANDHAGADTIPFNIPGDGVHTITPLTALPALTDDRLKPAASPGACGGFLPRL